MFRGLVGCLTMFAPWVVVSLFTRGLLLSMARTVPLNVSLSAGFQGVIGGLEI
jgi:hypothetical protein